MGDSEQLKAAEIRSGRERRSSVRVRSRLPCAVEPMTREEIPDLEAHILDLAVMESEGVMHDAVDWRDHAEDLSPEMVYVLNELRALRQQVGEIQRLVERYNEIELKRRWIEINDQGLWISTDESDHPWQNGQFASVHIQIPSIQTPEVVAIGRVIRIDDDGERDGTAFEFCNISQSHKQAISRYALRRERQMARSVRLDVNFG